MSARAVDVLKHVHTVAGYTTYIDLIRPLIEHKQVISTGMTREVDRVKEAIAVALSGKSCAIVSSGDAGVYAMAGLAFEICKEKKIRLAVAGSLPEDSDSAPALEIEVVPGIPALCSGASLLGAPLTHDFAAISLSDLLTPWERIERRLDAAARADFVIVLYNPKSKKRKENLRRAQEIILKYRDADTPVGVVVSAMRARQDVRIIRLADLHTAHVDMQTTVFIGSSATTTYLDFMFTPRGYAGKYQL
jgi:precorrin-3B C17-methyltransferase / cobalt-factor III methyltransferase